jgi:hypothetical protein
MPDACYEPPQQSNATDENSCSPYGKTAEERREYSNYEQRQNMERDKPLEDDPIGNAIVGAVGAGAVGGALGRGVVNMAVKGAGIPGKVMKEALDVPDAQYYQGKADAEERERQNQEGIDMEAKADPTCHEPPPEQCESPEDLERSKCELFEDQY